MLEEHHLIIYYKRAIFHRQTGRFLKVWRRKLAAPGLAQGLHQIGSWQKHGQQLLTSRTACVDQVGVLIWICLKIGHPTLVHHGSSAVRHSNANPQRPKWLPHTMSLEFEVGGALSQLSLFCIILTHRQTPVIVECCVFFVACFCRNI